MIVDTLGLPLVIRVTGAQVQDSEPEGAGATLWELGRRRPLWPALGKVWCDGNYRGTANLWAKVAGVWLRPVRRSGRGFEPLPGRWVIERSFGWADGFRRLDRDYEYKPGNSVGMLWLGFIHVMLNRIWNC